MSKAKTGSTREPDTYRFPRPYWLPKEIDYDALPPEQQRLFDEIIGPVYSSLVVGAQTPLERTTGVTVAFLLAMELFQQLDLARLMRMGVATRADEEKARADRQLQEKALASHLKVVRAKQLAAATWERLRKISQERGQLSILPLMAG